MDKQPIEKQEKELSPVTKIKIMLAAEYGTFAVIFAVLGILILTEVIKVAEWKRYVFTYLTVAGGLWITIDFFWTAFSQKRRQKNALIDKILLFPVGLILLGFDVYAISQGCAESLPYRYVIGIDLCYIASVYVFESIYHWFIPVPGTIEMALQDDAKALKEYEKSKKKK